jgi:hypothetical protein
MSPSNCRSRNSALAMKVWPGSVQRFGVPHLVSVELTSLASYMHYYRVFVETVGSWVVGGHVLTPQSRNL